MNIKAEEGRAINSALERPDLGVQEVKSGISGWPSRVEEDPGAQHVVEGELRKTLCRVARHVVAGMVREASGDGPTEQEIEAVREKAEREGNPLKAPLRNYPIRVTLLGRLRGAGCGSWGVL